MAASLWAQIRILPLKDVRPGMKGVGKTVFSGTRIEEFQVDVIGVLDNIGPRQSVILARLSGGPLADTGVLQGMSGSPVYIDGKLAGAVAMGFAFSKEPIAGIRPIEDMMRVESAASTPQNIARREPWDGRLASLVPPRTDVLTGGERMVDIATPVSFGGFTRATLEHFSPQLRSLGLEPRQGISGGGNPDAHGAAGAPPEPGSMISVQLLSGDFSVGADGTVTYVDGKHIAAFGHRFLSVGATELPFARAEVLTVLPNLSSSFKISTAKEWLGTVTQDRSVAIAGELGRPSSLVPMTVTVVDRGTPNAKPITYECRLVKDRVLSPFLVQMAVFSAIDATERTTGEASLSVTGALQFTDGSTPIKLNGMYSGDFGLAAQASMATAVPVSYAMQSGFPSLDPKRIDLTIESFPRKRQLQIDQFWASRREVKPGETVELTVVLSGENGYELTRKASYRVPVGAPPGPLQFTAADANIINLTEYRQLVATPPRNASQLIAFVNGLRANTKAYIRVWRTDPAYDVQGEILPAPPPSVSMILARTQPSLSTMPVLPNARVAELDLADGGMVISGSKTIQVEVKE